MVYLAVWLATINLIVTTEGDPLGLSEVRVRVRRLGLSGREVIEYDVSGLSDVFSDLLEEGVVLGGHHEHGVYRLPRLTELIEEGLVEPHEAAGLLSRACVVAVLGLNKIMVRCRHDDRTMVYLFRGLDLRTRKGVAEALRLLSSITNRGG